MKKKPNNVTFFSVFVLATVSIIGVITPMRVLKASDLQIYTGGTAGGTKTFVMMLDNSGSMGAIDLKSGVNCITVSTNYSFNGKAYITAQRTSGSGSGITYNVNYCEDSAGNKHYDRMSNLKIAMFNLMNTNTIASEKSITGQIDLSEVVIGIGAFPQGASAQILVPATLLGPIGSVQRLAIERAVANLSPTYRTPTAHAYTIGAAHLLGTSTQSGQVFREKYNKSAQGWSECTKWTTTAYQSTCVTWRPVIGVPVGINQYFNLTKYPGGLEGAGYYRKVQNDNPKIIENYWLSGSTWRQCTNWYAINEIGLKQCREWNTILASQPTDIWDYYLHHNHAAYYEANPSLYRKYGEDGEGIYVDLGGLIQASPLPAVADRKSCDGQGVYILSDGEPNDGPEAEVLPAMKNTLGSFGSDFSCPSNGLVNTTYGSESIANSGWHCMGEYAKRLYSASKNPQAVKFKTAFVGYGTAFQDLTNQDQINACKLGSSEKGDSCSTDSTSANLRNDHIGYGLGGYTYAQSSEDVLNSIVKFIDGLSSEGISSLSTGAWAVPVDTLNPLGLQPNAYMRVLQPEPGTNKVSWIGNLKKYHLVDGVLRLSESTTSSTVLNSDGRFAGPSDMWSDTTGDGEKVTLGGAYAQVPLPFKNTTLNKETQLRRIFSDISVSNNTIVSQSNDSSQGSESLLKIVSRADSDITNASFVLNQFKTQDTLKFASNRVKRSLLNYLGYSLEINDLDLPETLDSPIEPQNAMGGIIHSLPLQLTYEGDLDEEGVLGNTRKQYTLFGTMEGGLRLVDAANGVEQMTFVPSEILLSTTAQIALKPEQSNATGLAHGVDAPWVADARYEAKATTVSEKTTTAMTASRMNVYGGLRMGGESYYGLDFLNPKDAKFLFRIGSNQPDFSRMGQSWSKPVIANIKFQGKVRRVMIVGGGYDTCYENPRFTLKGSGDDLTCATKTKAKGNAVYIVDALTGARLWWTSDSGSNKDNVDLKHSIVSSISTADGNNDGLVDHLYFGDLGGQVFRIDLNNHTTATSTADHFAARVVKLVNLATTNKGVSISNGDNPRFYEAPTITVHRDNGKKFIHLGLVAGDRSSPLDVAPNERIGLPALLTNRPVNHVYGIMDIDAVKPKIMNPETVIETKDLTLANLQVDPKLVYATALQLINSYAPYKTKPLIGVDQRIFGWYHSLSSTYNGVEKANDTYRKKGGLKAFEAPIAIAGNLIISVYDPESSVLGYNNNPCQARIIGETYRQYYCIPFGACLTQSNGNFSFDTNFEKRTAYQDPKDTANTNKNRNPIGVGIQGNALAPKPQTTVTECGALQLAGIDSGTGEWACSIKQQPLNWYSSSIRSN